MTLRRAGPGDPPALAELALLLWPGHTRDALEAVAPRIADFAEREGLHAHARSVTIRYEN